MIGINKTEKYDINHVNMILLRLDKILRINNVSSSHVIQYGKRLDEFDAIIKTHPYYNTDQGYDH